MVLYERPHDRLADIRALLVYRLCSANFGPFTLAFALVFSNTCLSYFDFLKIFENSEVPQVRECMWHEVNSKLVGFKRCFEVI